MDKESYIDILDIYYVTKEEIFKKKKRIIKNSIVVSTIYDDDVFNRQLSGQLFWIQPNLSMLPPADSKYKYALSHENTFGYLKHYLYAIVILALLTTAAFIFWYTFNTSQDISSSKKYPLLNLCDPVNPYSVNSWFTPSPTEDFLCDVPLQINEIFIEGMMSYWLEETRNCLSKLDCMSLIGLYLAEKIKDKRYNFFIDYNSNVYEVRGWFCPYVSGQLWVAIISDTYSPDGGSGEMKRLLHHFNKKIVSYAVKCKFLNFDSLKTNYLNVTSVYSIRSRK